MPTGKEFPPEQQKLIRRYLVWCYKTTKEDLDRIDRYFTQLAVDKVILSELRARRQSKVKDRSLLDGYAKKVGDFEVTMQKKEESVLPKKYSDPQKKILHPDYLYLQARLAGIERAIRTFLGKKELTAIQNSYEQEMTRRILEAREHT